MAKAKAKPKKARSKPKAKPKPKKPLTPAALAKVEANAKRLLADNDAGMIDNVWDVLDELEEVSEQLPKTSSIYKAWKAFYDEMIEIIAGDS